MSTENHTDGQTKVEIPCVPQKYGGILGNVPDLDGSFVVKSYWHLADLYGPIFKLDLLGRPVVVLHNYEFINEACDDDRFEKAVGGPMLYVRDQIGDGLFTAFNDEMNWAKAHRILVPHFGPMGVRKMFDQQLDISSQLILKWDRLGPENRIVASDDFTKLAFDTIGFCSFSYRFNEFYGDGVHPFAQQMADALREAGRRATRTNLENKLRFIANQKYWSDINAMHRLCDDIIDERIANPQPDNHDLLNIMLNQEDPETHTKLDRKNIKFNMATFLVAGHETTSGTLSFLFHNLLTNPEKYHKAQQEIDEVLGDGPITVDHLPKLIYLDACLKETLRFKGPIDLLGRKVRKTLLLGGKYEITPDIRLMLVIRGLHHDPAVWGDDVADFKPERMIPQDKIPKGALRPFGIGVRSCIGRAFAEQEMILCAALILQRFQVELADPNYVLALKSTLTVKPDGLELKVRRRPGRSIMVGLQGAPNVPKEASTTKDEDVHKQTNGANKRPMTVLFSSNSGTCKAFADELVASATAYDADVKSMDSATENVPKHQPVVIITPTYEGKPADNAKKFVSWLEFNKDNKELLKDVQYTVFGVGNSDWNETFHKVPKLVDHMFSQLGATRIHDLGVVDVKSDITGPWEDFVESLLSSLGQEGTAPSDEADNITATFSTSESNEIVGGPKLLYATVRENIQIADDSVGPPKKHIEIELPENTAYRTGDYLNILARNHVDIVKRVQRRFDLSASDKILISGTRKPHLKTSSPILIVELLALRVELNTPITQRQLAKLATVTKDPTQKESIERLASDEAFKSEILGKRVSILDVLEDHPSCELPFAAYLEMLKAMMMRQYSISSSPLSPKNFGSEKLVASISYDIHSGGELANPDRSFNGVASSYLSVLQPGEKIRCAVSSTNASFHLPRDPAVPIIMIAAGTGLAPMRGFIEERAALANASGRKIGPALLYFGCRDFEKDYIYKEELEHWQELEVVQLRPAFSKRGPDGEKNWKYIPDRMWDEREEIADLFNAGAKIFVCGSASKLAKSTAEVSKKIYQDKTGKSEEEAKEWLDKAREDRYVSDVFG